MSRRLHTLALLSAMAGCLALVATRVDAQDLSAGTPIGDMTPVDVTERALAESRTSWKYRRPRWFVAGNIDAGYLYATPRLFAGYGRPHWLWGGVEASPIISSSQIGGFLGLRFDAPRMTLRLGGRYVHGLWRSYLIPQNRFDIREVEWRGGEKARYFSYEAELASSVPVGPGAALALFTLMAVDGVPEDRFIFEQNLRAVMKPPFAWRARVGYALLVHRDPPASVGPAFEVVGLSSRQEYITRAGIVANLVLFDDLELLGTWIPVITSPDALGLTGGDFANFGVRYRWATGGRPDPTESGSTKEAVGRRRMSMRAAF